MTGRPWSQSEFGSGLLQGSAVPCDGGQVDADGAGPVTNRLAERVQLVGGFVRATDAGQLFDEVTEWLDVAKGAASPATPQEERPDLSSQGSNVVDGVFKALAHEVAVQRRAGLVGACACLVAMLDVSGGVSSDAFEM